ncbi:hypothetical protein [Lacisediminimonas profundi]|uniref:hypothetical protein n=1 Tax=Lacisediminimonas profundi TaxID=2603856 RepID=UPI001F4FD6A7|nr:hypothetical protein [Lacisediminimonas profundi]
MIATTAAVAGAFSAGFGATFATGFSAAFTTGVAAAFATGFTAAFGAGFAAAFGAGFAAALAGAVDAAGRFAATGFLTAADLLATALPAFVAMLNAPVGSIQMNYINNIYNY